MNRMNCHEFETRLNDVLDRRDIPLEDGVLTSHAAECSTCCRLLSTQLRVMETIGKAISKSEDHSNIGLSFVEPSLPQPRRSRNWMLAVATAVCLAIALMLPQANDHSADAPLSQMVHVHDSSRAIPDTELEVVTEEHSQDSTILVAMDDAVESWNHFLASRTENTAWLEPVATPIRPLANSMTSTFNVLRQAMPRVRRVQHEQHREGLGSAHFLDGGSPLV
ncbi:hypothetical protein ACFL2H_07990 [Planctomycetota bacterium]